MRFPTHFIRATEQASTFEAPVAAPYFRKTFEVSTAQTGNLVISGLGFYELYVNGHRLTKGPLAPYISNPDDLVYFDAYTVELQPGRNVIGVLLGNGLQNNKGGLIWGFDKAKWLAPPQMALRLEYTDAGEDRVLEADETFRTAPSPIVRDDHRFGEVYDARRELPGWNLPDFDDSHWAFALPAPRPRGDARLCEAEPLAVTQERHPVSITPEGDGFRYDFGENWSGVCRLTVAGTAGQTITLLHAERLQDGAVDRRNLWFPNADSWERDKDIIHRDTYICKGEGTETYTPTFTYHGFRYVLVTGITAEQATPSLLTYLVINSALEERGGFHCSDEVANKLQECTRHSDLSNFHYFPTDCPHREKNGWTADAALSAEHMLLNLNPETSYREWMRGICKAQNDAGALPGIIPTGGWGFDWGNGPAWDCVLVYLPYLTYVYRGDRQILEESAASILRYLHYIGTRIGENGLIEIGLGDWCPAERWVPKAPLVFTDTVITIDIARKSAYIFGELGMKREQAFAQSLADDLLCAAREKLIDHSTMIALGNCQTTQAMALYYGLFEPGERPAAFQHLLTLIDRFEGHLDVGVLGGRVLFHVLSDFGRSDLAFSMITRPDGPSYGNWIARGATTLWEDFNSENQSVNSHNHHFWGDISSWFIQTLAGIRFNPHRDNLQEVDIIPHFIPQLNEADGFHIAPAGRIASKWERQDDRITLTVEVPDGMTGRIVLPDGWVFDDNMFDDAGLSTTRVRSGVFSLRKDSWWHHHSA